MPTTNERVRKRFEAGGALNSHGSEDHDEDYVTVIDGVAEVPTVADTASEPAAEDLEGGEIWFNVDEGEYRGYDGSSIGTIGFTADGA